MRGISKPFVVDLISNMEDALGVVVPIPALPVAGNVFWVCALIMQRTLSDIRRKVFFMVSKFYGE
jgi:hypothetical protein